MRANRGLDLIGSAWGVFFAAVLALSAGASLGVWQLISRPAKIVDALPAHRQAREIVFWRGNENPTADWQEKMARMTRPASAGTLRLTGGDLNAFFKHAVTENPMQTSLNVRLSDTQAQLGVITRPTWLPAPLCLQTHGVFKRGADGFYFAPTRTYIGSLPLPDAAAQALVNLMLMKMFSQPGARPLAGAWQLLSDVSVQNERMILVWK